MQGVIAGLDFGLPVAADPLGPGVMAAAGPLQALDQSRFLR